MSKENVEFVRQLHPGPDVDLVQLFRDDDIWAAAKSAIAPLYDPDFECVMSHVEPVTYRGLDGLREGWRDWLTPWTTYRAEVEEAIDLGDRVLVLVRDFGRREGSAQEVALTGAAVWTVREGKIARSEHYADRSEALEAVGLAG